MSPSKLWRVPFAAIVALPLAIAGCAPPPIAGADYELVFADEFDTFDASVWSTNEPWYPPPPPGSISVNDGVLTLRSRASDGYPIVDVPSLGPRSGTSYPHYPDATTFEEGYFEVRMRFTDSPHSRPAFWLLGSEWAQRWPESACPTLQAEWDLFEPLLLPAEQFHAAQHRNTSSPCGVPRTGRGIKRTVAFDLSEWHVYGGKWEDGRICAYLDNVEMGCMEAFDTMAQPMYLILTQRGQCPAWQGTACAQPKPRELIAEFDWVRVWQRTEP